MSYILRNVTRGDLSLANTLNIRHNGCVTVEEVTEALRNEERKGIIRIESLENLTEEPVEIPIKEILIVEPAVEKLDNEVIIESPIVELKPDVSVEEVVEPIAEIEESEEEKPEVTNNSPRSFNNKNDYKNKFKK